MLRNLASSLILTERPTDSLDPNPVKMQGRVVTTLQKAKEVRPLVEKCVAIACRSLQHERQAEQFATTAERGTDAWRQWRRSDQWQQWSQARAPVVKARRRVFQLLGDKQAVRVLFEQIAPRFEDRPGGYTRVLRLANPRLGDAGTRALIEFVGRHDRQVVRALRPVVAEDESAEHEGAVEQPAADEPALEESAAEETGGEEPGGEKPGEEKPPE